MGDGVAAVVAGDLAVDGPVAADGDPGPFGVAGDREDLARDGHTVVSGDDRVDGEIDVHLLAAAVVPGGVGEDGRDRELAAVRAGDVLDGLEHADESDHASRFGISAGGSELGFELSDASFEVGLGGGCHVVFPAVPGRKNHASDQAASMHC